MSGAVRLLRQGAVATLLLDQPARRNAMTRAMWRTLPALVAEAARDASVAVLRLEGAGGHFCGGADISEFAETYATLENTTRANAEIGAAVEALAAFPKPAVAVIRGACVGGGVALALACDLRFAADDARFAVTPAKLGLIYSQADATRLMRAVGAARAKDLLFTARLVEAAEALRIGLVEEVCAAEALEDFVAQRIAPMVAGSRPALRAIKAVANAIEDGAEWESAELRTMFDEAFAGDDFREGYEAFLAKRAPVFRAR
ncbi:enoyl-CoA hydratase [Falsiroseomonas bella]|uniref:Enoyl-CoA hydratase n=1 Tax=Falsiroseomonas bella TaxID=2184016 RepID=A0A317FCH5_9PROT|nr:enoyl-CoA hydratase-related protein [Falsiroseomonas bella]PWS36545.1 enoyl-CoA hydratase [Falsiroseomonas bella]